MAAISGVGRKSIFEGASPILQVQQFFARFEKMDSSSNPQVEEMLQKKKNVFTLYFGFSFLHFQRYKQTNKQTNRRTNE